MITRANHRWGRRGIASVGVPVVLVVALLPAAPAAAASCTTPIRYALSTNTIYVTSGSFTPTQIVAACAAAPLTQTDPSTHTWELRADLVLQNGASLVLHGTSAGGDVDRLRLRSAASGAATEVSSVTAQWGTIDVDDVDVTSWDDA